MKKQILFCTQWVDRYRSLIRALLATDKFDLYCDENLVAKYGEIHPNLHSYQPLIPSADGVYYEREAGSRLVPMLHVLTQQLRTSINHSEQFKCLEDTQLMSTQLKESLMQTLYMIDAFDQIVDSVKLDLLITDGPGIRQQAWVAAAKKRNVPSLEIYHGMIHVKPELVPGRLDQADFMAMGSALIKEVYIQLGMPPSSLRVTGLPADPSIQFSKGDAKKILAEKYGLDPDKKIALLYTAYDSGDTFEFLHDLTTGYQVDILRQTLHAVQMYNRDHAENLQLIVKRHPTLASSGWDDERAYHYYADQAGQKIFTVNPYESNPLLLAAADVALVVKFSSTISEAINANLPVIIWPVSRVWLHDDLLNSGALVPVDDQKSLDQTLENCLEDNQFLQQLDGYRQKFLQKYPHVDVTEATPNIVKFISDVTESEMVHHKINAYMTHNRQPRNELVLESTI